MDRHSPLDLDPAVRDRLLAANAATPDRLLKPIRTKAGSRRRRKRSLGKRVPVRTYYDRSGPPPGYLEIDLVVHSGGLLSGSFIRSLVAADVCTGWTEAVPLLAKEQSLIVDGLEAIGQRLPFPSAASTPTMMVRSSTRRRSGTPLTTASSSPGPERTAAMTRHGLSRRTATWCAASSAMTAIGAGRRSDHGPTLWRAAAVRELLSAVVEMVDLYLEEAQKKCSRDTADLDD